MKKLFLLLVTALALASCSPRLTEKVVISYPDGRPQVVRLFTKSGDCVREVEYYSSGQVKMEGSIKNGEREGEWFAYFPDGRTQSHGFFKDGKRTGAATVWQENGNLYHEGFYKEDKHCGHWKFYDEQGNLLKEVDYGE